MLSTERKTKEFLQAVSYKFPGSSLATLSDCWSASLQGVFSTALSDLGRFRHKGPSLAQIQRDSHIMAVHSLHVGKSHIFLSPLLAKRGDSGFLWREENMKLSHLEHSAGMLYLPHTLCASLLFRLQAVWGKDHLLLGVVSFFTCSSIEVNDQNLTMYAYKRSAQQGPNFTYISPYYNDSQYSMFITFTSLAGKS